MSTLLSLTIKEYAAREKVDERTVRRWIAKGAVEIRRTPGGRPRVLVQDSDRVIFLRAFADDPGHSVN